MDSVSISQYQSLSVNSSDVKVVNNASEALPVALLLAGAPAAAFTVTLTPITSLAQAVTGLAYIKNTTSQAATITTGIPGGATVSVAASTSTLLFCDGVNVATVSTETGDSLAGLTDVTLTSPSDNQILKFDFGLGKWVNATPAGGGSSFSTPVIDSSSSATQVLGASAGASAVTSLNSGNTAGQLYLETGTSPAADDILTTITFGTVVPFTNLQVGPIVVLSAGDANGAAVLASNGVFTVPTSTADGYTGFEIHIGSALTGGGYAFTLNWIVINR